jgi:hypothetical protein
MVIWCADSGVACRNRLVAQVQRGVLRFWNVEFGFGRNQIFNKVGGEEDDRYQGKEYVIKQVKATDSEREKNERSTNKTYQEFSYRVVPGGLKQRVAFGASERTRRPNFGNSQLRPAVKAFSS